VFCDECRNFKGMRNACKVVQNAYLACAGVSNVRGVCCAVVCAEVVVRGKIIFFYFIFF